MEEECEELGRREDGNGRRMGGRVRSREWKGGVREREEQEWGCKLVC